MNSGFSDFQDLINTTTSGEDLQSLQDEVKALEDEVADNKADIQTNSGLISLNTTSIANNLNTINTNAAAINNNVNAINNNTVLIQIEAARITTNQNNITVNDQRITANLQAILTEQARITTNSQNIATNTQSISNNSVDITSLNNTVLLRDGSVQLDQTFTPTNTYDLVTKSYVDSKVIPGNFLPLSGGTMTGDIDMGNNSLINIFDINGTNWNAHVTTVQSNTNAIGTKLDSSNGTVSNNLYFGNTSNYILRTGSAMRFQSQDYFWFIIGQTLYAQIGNNLFSVYESMEFTSTLNGINVAEFSRLGGVTSSIQTQLDDLDTAITTLDNDLQAQINTKLSKTGGTMSGDINMGLNTLTDCAVIENHNASLPNQAGTGGNDLIFKSHYWPSGGNYSFHNSITIKAVDNVLGNGSVNIGSSLSTIGHHLFVGNGQNSIRLETATATDNTLGMHGGTVNGPRLQGRFGGALSVTHTGPAGSTFNPQDILTWGGEFGDVELYNDLTVGGSISSTGTITSSGGTLSGVLDMGSNKITNLATGTLSTDGVNKGQLDSALTTKVSKSGDSMTGDLNLTSNSLLFNNSGTVTPKIESSFGEMRITHPDEFIIGASPTSSNYIFPMSVSGLNPCYIGNHLAVNNSLNVAGQAAVGDGFLVQGDETIIAGSSGNMVGSGIRQLYLRHPLCPSNKEYGWRMGCQQPINTSSTDMDMYFEVMRGTSSRIAAGLWDQNGSSSAINFTGQHRCMPNFKYTEDKVGLIVEATGRYMNFIKEGEECSQISCITINDSLPIVEICTEEKSKKVFGVISSEEEKDRNFQQGVFVSFFDKVEQDKRLYINGVGEGAMWVCDKNGTLENGDWVCSAGVAGYGMRQDEEYLANWTVAKITMDCDFNPQMEEVKIWENGGWVYTGEFKPAYECIALDDGMKIAFVGCTYHCG